jgi:pimeloyl-ACP methyl ester carboxylesterase
MKKAILLILLLVLCFGVFLWGLAPQLPPQTSQIIKEVRDVPLSDLITGDTGRVVSGDVELWFESIKPEGQRKGVVLLIMGITADALEWPRYFYGPLVEQGYEVIRYDHRGTGLSSWIHDWNRNNAYTLHHMANDALVIMDALDVEKAHVLGMSMGGMIGQILAIDHPDRVNTLISVMSSGYIQDPELPGIPLKTYLYVAGLGLRYVVFGDKYDRIKLSIGLRQWLSDGQLGLERVRVLAEQAVFRLDKLRGFNPNAVFQHREAIYATGPRYEGLATLQVPALIIHGYNDPLIHIDHGKKCARIIPGADSLWLEGMGHDILKEFTPAMHDKILDFLNMRN